ncbi:MAG: fused MFS/spermidine synthase [Planctomycetota bacterium]
MALAAPTPFHPVPLAQARPSTARLVSVLFFASGAAGLVYQVLWMRALGLFLGSDMYGVSIILGAFMGGLALGSLVGGRLAERTSRPLFWYGVAELGIGGAALSLQPLLTALEPLLQRAYPLEASAPTFAYVAARLGLAVAALLVPTTLMGATLPLVLRHFVRERAELGRITAHFYAVNTLGALVGTLAAGFVLLPYLGMRSTTLVIASLNVAIGLICVAVGAPRSVGAPEGRPTPSDAAQDGGAERANGARIARAAALGLAVSGFASFGFEVVWTRVLLISFSATVYSFASMLACFLFGIFFGSFLVRNVVDRHPNPLALLAKLEVWIGASVAALALLINVVPGFFGHLLGFLSTALGAARGSALVVATLAASFLLLVVPTTMLGATFSVALRAYTANVARVGSRAGNLYAANTLGAILGSFATGLALIPALGVRPTFGLIAALFTLNGLALLRVAGRTGAAEAARGARPRKAFGVALATGVAIVASLFVPYRMTLNFNQNAGVDTELLYHAEGIQNTIDVVRSKRGVTSLVIGGNVEADDGYVQLRHFILKGHLPLMFLEDPQNVLVVGLGMGITLNATARHPGVERIDVVELSPEILAAQAVLHEVNDDIVHNPLVHIRIDDGRSFMRLTSGRYDMITADPIHPKISRVGYLYTQQYYESIRDHLDEDGIVCQWMPLYQVAPSRLRSAMASFHAAFPNATFWYVKNHGLFIAKRDSPMLDYALLERAFAQPNVREDLASIDITSPEELLSLLLLGPDEVRAFLAAGGDVPLNTDDFPYLEHFVPRDLFYGTDAIMAEIVPHLVDPTRYVIGQPQASIDAVRARCVGRGERILEELRPGAPRAADAH